KAFRKATGMTFTDYLARVRVEKVKNLLLNPQRRVSEAAYAAGFQSLSQFNRVFRRIAGESPTVFRDRLHGAEERKPRERRGGARPVKPEARASEAFSGSGTEPIAPPAEMRRPPPSG